MKFIFRLFTFLFLVFDFALAQPDTLWTRTFGTGADETGWTATQSATGGYLVATRRTNGSENNLVLYKVDAGGDSIWSRLYGAASGPASVGETSSSGYLIAVDNSLLCIDSDGDSLWVQHLGSSSPERYVSVHALSRSSFGFTLTGYHHWDVEYPPIHIDVVAIRSLTADGTLVWYQSDVNPDGRGLAITHLTSGAVAVVAYSSDPAIYGPYYLNTRTSTGVGIAFRYFGQPHDPVDRSGDVVALPNGNFVTALNVSGTDDPRDVLLAELTQSLDTIWTRTISIGQGEYLSGIARAENGDFLIGGWQYSGPNGAADLLLARTDSQGQPHWVRSYGGAGNDFLSDIIAIPDSGYLLVGSTYSYGAGGSDIYLLAVRGEAPESSQEDDGDVCRSFILSSFPNPFNPATTISFSLPRTSTVSLAVYDITGRKVETLIDKSMAAGEHHVDFDGSALPSGLYFARLTAGDFSQTQKMVLLK